MPVLGHIAGPSGSGKTTLLQQIQKAHPHIIAKDLDELDEQAEQELGYSVPKKLYSDEMLDNLYQRRQQLLDRLVEKDAPIILGGHHWENNKALRIPTKNKWRLDVGPLRSAWRAYRRSQQEEPHYRRLLRELPEDYREAKKDIRQLNREGYTPLPPQQIKAMVAELVGSRPS